MQGDQLDERQVEVHLIEEGRRFIECIEREARPTDPVTSYGISGGATIKEEVSKRKFLPVYGQRTYKEGSRAQQSQAGAVAVCGAEFGNPCYALRLPKRTVTAEDGAERKADSSEKGFPCAWDYRQ